MNIKTNDTIRSPKMSLLEKKNFKFGYIKFHLAILQSVLGCKVKHCQRHSLHAYAYMGDSIISIATR